MGENNHILLSMSAPPYWHCGYTIKKRSLDYLVALLPAVLMALYNWGFPALRVMALSVVTCVLVEAIGYRIMGRDLRIDDLTAVVTGLLFSFMLPAASPWWLVIVGAGCAMIFGKVLFGGLGNCPVSTPLVGWAILFISFPTHMDANLVQLASTWVDPLSRLRYFGAVSTTNIPLLDLLLGQQTAPLGAGQVGGLLLGGLYLLFRGVIRWQIVVGILLGCGVPFAIMQVTHPGATASVLFQFCSGSIILCGFFMATDSSIAPAHTVAMVLYGITCGLLMFLIRTFGSYADGAPFAVLVTSLLTPYFDMIRPKPFGVR